MSTVRCAHRVVLCVRRKAWRGYIELRRRLWLRTVQRVLAKAGRRRKVLELVRHVVRIVVWHHVRERLLGLRLLLRLLLGLRLVLRELRWALWLLHVWHHTHVVATGYGASGPRRSGGLRGTLVGLSLIHI